MYAFLDWESGWNLVPAEIAGNPLQHFLIYPTVIKILDIVIRSFNNILNLFPNDKF